MKKLVLLGLLLVLGGTNVFAWECAPVVGASTPFRCTQVVFNDSGGALTSGSVVIWDNDDTEFDRSGYPYVTTVASADHDWVAGVTVEDSIPDQSLGTIVVWGPAITRISGASETGFVEDTTVSTSSVAGEIGDWDGGANECYLGLLMELLDARNQAAITRDNQSVWVFVDPACED